MATFKIYDGSNWIELAKKSDVPSVPSWALSSTKPSYNFSEIGAGNITIGDGANTYYYRTAGGVKSGFYYHTAGDESVVFANQYAGTGWMFVEQTNPENRTSWQSLSPTLQIKKGGVTINKLIGQGASPAYNLDVNGTLNATTIYENGTTLANTYLGKTAQASDSAKLNGQSASYYQQALPTTTTAGKVLKSTSTAGVVEWGNDNNSNTWRPINVNNSSAINDTSTTVNFTGSGTTSVSYSNGTITISSADSFTGYSSSNKLSASYISGLSTVATSGSYNDLSNKPTIPATNVIPAQTTANKVLLSTTTSGTAAWSSWSSAGFLKTNSSGVVSVDTNSYYLASNPNNYTSNTGTVTSVSAGTGLSISGTASTTPTVNIASGYKLPTTTEWGNKADASSLSNYLPLSGGCMDDNGSIWFNKTQWNSENYYGITYDSTNTGLLLRSQGNKFVLQGSGTYVGMFSLPTLTANRTWTLPSSTGTIALTTSNVSSATTATTATKLSYTTTAPTSANSSGLKVVVLSSEPTTKYAGYLYIITT